MILFIRFHPKFPLKMIKYRYFSDVFLLETTFGTKKISVQSIWGFF